MMLPAPRPSILDIEPYVGGESKLAGVNRVIKLSSNEGAFGPSPKAIEAFRSVAEEIHRYPDGGAGKLREAIGARFGLDPARIVCGAGSDDLLCQLALVFGGEGTETIQTEHGFLMYGIFSRYAGSAVLKAPERERTADVDAILALVTPRTKVVFLANPNNPTGSYIPAEEVHRLRARLPEDVVLVLDGAYAEYVDAPDWTPGTELVEAGTNTVMTRTFSKMFGMGGLRLGWCYAPAHIVDLLNRVRGPFNASVPAQAAGIAALSDRAHFERSLAHNSECRAWTTAELRAAGVKVAPSVGNFVLADMAASGRDVVAADAYLRARGIIVRRVAGYGLPDCLRITIGTSEEMRLCCAAMAEFMASGQGLLAAGATPNQTGTAA
ncbi:MAG: histidinol-phosphate transaminase [Alphaproteobacteria bacterium]|nr:histidinol-phosphate transaminase [Alphaproteobacteria bacterium]